jgi:hypothetical protein
MATEMSAKTEGNLKCSMWLIPTLKMETMMTEEALDNLHTLKMVTAIIIILKMGSLMFV